MAKFAWAVFWITKLNFCFIFIYRTKFSEWNALQILGAIKEAVSKSYRTLWTFFDLNLVSFLKSHGFSIIGKTFFIISAAKPNITLNISIASFCRLWWWILKKNYLSSNTSKELVYSLYTSLNALSCMWLIRLFNFLE